MKKLLSFSISLALTFFMFVNVLAANAICTLDVASELKKDATTTVTVKLSDTPTLSSALIQIELGSGLELVSGQWLASGTLKDFTLSSGYGVLALSDPSSMNGAVFSFVIKGKNISSQQVKVTVTFKNGANEIGTATATKSIKVICATHSFGSYQSTNGSQHSRTCSICSYVEKTNHTWDNGTTTKDATCNTDGSKSLTCTKCAATKTEKISATQNHSFGEWSQTKAPTCTEKGQQIRSCSICQTAEFGDIDALGHTLTNSTIIKQPTCADSGVEKGFCTRCNTEAENVLAPAGHLYGNAITSVETTCTICGHTHKETLTQTPTPDVDTSPIPEESSTGISPWWLAVVAIISIAIGAALGILLTLRLKQQKEKFSERIYEDF